jgi:hypothetical protein
MSSRWWFPFDGMEEIPFKRVPEGWVFGAPNPGLFGPRRYYLLNDEQKAEVGVRLRRMWWMLLAAICVAVVVLVPVSLPGMYQYPLAMLAADVLIGLAIGLALNVYFCRSIRPIVAGLPTTAERITRGDAFRTQVTVLSRGYIIFFALLSLVLLALCAAQPLFGPAGWDTLSIVGTLLFGTGTLYWAVLFVAKLRHSAG